jgi:hypothetical protein
MRGYSNRTALRSYFFDSPIAKRYNYWHPFDSSDSRSTLTPEEIKYMIETRNRVQNDSSIYSRTYYYMERKWMFELRNHPHLVLPFWIRDFVDVFQDIDDDSVTVS